MRFSTGTEYTAAIVHGIGVYFFLAGMHASLNTCPLCAGGVTPSGSTCAAFKVDSVAGQKKVEKEALLRCKNKEKQLS